MLFTGTQCPFLHQLLSFIPSTFSTIKFLCDHICLYAKVFNPIFRASHSNMTIHSALSNPVSSIHCSSFFTPIRVFSSSALSICCRLLRFLNFHFCCHLSRIPFLSDSVCLSTVDLAAAARVGDMAAWDRAISSGQDVNHRFEVNDASNTSLSRQLLSFKLAVGRRNPNRRPRRGRQCCNVFRMTKTALTVCHGSSFISSLF